jgi:outer membrane protein
MKSKIVSLVLAAAGAVWLAPAAAQDNTVRAGIYIVRYDIKADDFSGPVVTSGLNLDVKNVNTPYFAYLRRVTPNIEIEIAAGWPPKTETVAKGPATVGSVPYDGQVIATSKWFSPSLLAIYKFFDPSTTWRPYLGAGVNYTHFFDRTSTPEGDAVTGGPTTISLSDSWGPAGTVGITWQMDRNWSLDASYSMAKVKSKLEANTSGAIRRTTINFNPSTWVLAIGYSF